MNYIHYIFLLIFLSLYPALLQSQPSPPQLVAPENGAQNQLTTIRFIWNSSTNADTYQIQIAEDPEFQSIYADYQTSSTSIVISGFTQNETYYWRVRAGVTTLLITEYGDWSSIWFFKTSPPAPDAPVLSAPENGASGVSVNPTLDWNPADKADSYRVQIDESSDFASPVADKNNLTNTNTEISGLDNGVTYHWRVNAANESGTSDWSEVWSFTTATEPPPPPNLIAPNNGVTEVSTTTTLQWEEVENADRYDFQIALDEQFNQQIVNQQNVVSTHYGGNFDEYTIHYWRVRSKNEGGVSEWSSVWNFTTERTSSTIAIESPVRNEILNGDENYTIRWQASNRVEELTIELNTGRPDTWIIMEEGIQAASGSYTWTVPDSSSANARIRITEMENAENYATSDSFILYPSSVNLVHHYRFNSARSQSDYRLMGLPADTHIPVDEIFTGTAGRDWNVYFDNGAEVNYLVPYDSTEVFTFKPGTAFWAISRSDLQISRTAESVTLSSDTTFTIPLQEGWNVITNPFGMEISWAAVQTKNDFEDPIWEFEGTFRESSLFEMYKGYYFYNRNNLEQLVIPYLTDSEDQPNQLKQEINDKQIITLNILHNNELQSSIEIGTRANTAGDPGPEFDFAPPGDFQKYRIAIDSGDLLSGYPQLSRLLHTPSTEQQSFDISIKSPVDVPLHIRATGLNNFSSDDVQLIDKRTSKSYDLHQNPDLWINSSEEMKHYSLVIGKSESVSEYLNRSGPQQTTLIQNYPNPFNNQTVIEYSVGQNMANSRVVLEIFNVVGQRIATLVNEQQPAGFYQINWNTNNSPGQPLASGLYFYRLQVGDIVKTRRLTLLK